MAGEAKVDPQIALRKIASSAPHLVLLDKIAGRGTEPRVERKRVALFSLKFKADPMVARPSLGAQNHWFPFQVLDHNIQVAVIEQVANCKPATLLWNLYCGTGKLAYVAESAVVLVEIEKLRLAKGGADILCIHLRVDVAVGDNQVGPAIVV